MERKHTNNELFAMVRDKNLIIAIEDITEILDTCWPLDYKDTFNVPEEKGKTDFFGALGENGRYLVFLGGGILLNGKNDVPGLKALGEKEKAGKLLLRRSLINRILAGETDCLKEPLTPEAIGQFERERDLIQEGVLKAVGPLLDPDSIITQPGGETAGNGKSEKNNGGISLPPEIDRPEARKAFEKALKAGYLEKTSTGYKWKGLPKAAAAYLCEKIYCPAITDKHPDWGLLGQFLGFDRLGQTAYQNRATQKEMPWKQAINELFED
jgi:hypothetical protein